MHSETFEISKFDSAEEAKKAGHTIPLTDKQAAMLSEKNRSQRRAWARSKGYFPPEEHNAYQQRQNANKVSQKQKKRATLKMQRRARRLARA